MSVSTGSAANRADGAAASEAHASNIAGSMSASAVPSAEPASAPGRERPASGLRVAYIMSRFPKITETFVLYEMKALEDMGAEVEVFPLLRQPPGRRHPDAGPYEERAHFMAFLSWEILKANVGAMVREPRNYVQTWWEALSGTFGSLRFFLGAIAYVPKCVAFADRMRSLGVKHIHAHFANHPALAALVIHRLTGIPYSFTAHGSDLHVERRMLPQKVAAASFVVAVSEYNRELIADECAGEDRDKIVVIHCGTDPVVFDPAARDPVAGRPVVLEPPASGPVAGGPPSLRIACIASLEEVKGHRFLLHACRLLVDRGVDVRCDMAGDGPLRGWLEELSVDHGLAERVQFRGALPRWEVGRILAEADVMVLASYPTPSGKREGIPVALMEAMMSGVPVVASGLSGIPELVEDGRTGFLIPPGDPWTLAERLERLAVDPELSLRLGSAGQARVLAEFDLRTGAEHLVQQIQRVHRDPALEAPR